MLTFGGLGDGLLGLGLGLGCGFAFRLDSFGFLRWCHRSTILFVCFLVTVFLEISTISVVFDFKL